MSEVDLVLALGPAALAAIESYDEAQARVSALTRELGGALKLCPQGAVAGRRPHLIEFYAEDEDNRHLGVDNERLGHCSACSAAQLLVHQRMSARQEVGVQKRRLRSIARRLRAVREGRVAGVDPRQIAMFEGSAP